MKLIIDTDIDTLKVSSWEKLKYYIYIYIYACICISSAHLYSGGSDIVADTALAMRIV